MPKYHELVMFKPRPQAQAEGDFAQKDIETTESTSCVIHKLRKSYNLLAKKNYQKSLIELAH